MRTLRFGLIGCGFWAQFQLAAWRELSGAECVAVVDQELSKAEALASRFGIPAALDSAEQIIASRELDFIDIVTNVETHPELVGMAAAHRIAAICQKPMASSLEQAQEMVETMRMAGVPLLIHENWRWQPPIRRLKEILQSGQLGNIVRARIDYANSFPVFENQPFLKTLDQFILTDIGTHILDVARFLFGEVSSLYCDIRRMRQDIAGEDVATTLLRTQAGFTVTCNMSYASHWQRDRFPQTFVDVEGAKAGVTLDSDYRITIYGPNGQHSEVIPIADYSWSDPAYALIHASIVDCHRNLLGSLQSETEAETTGEDNLRTLQLVYGSYTSAQTESLVRISQ